MKGNLTLPLLISIMTFSGLGVFLSAAQAQKGSSQPEGSVLGLDVSTSGVAETTQSIMDYWTEERMQNAVPIPTPTHEVEGAVSETATVEVALGPLVIYPGWNSKSGLPQPGPNDRITLTAENSHLVPDLAQPQHTGALPTNPKDGPYGPFQRWTHFGNYLAFPRSVIGKLFVTIPGFGPGVCSATVTGLNMVLTAAHCNSDGNGSTGSNRMFCPSWFKGGPTGTGVAHPARGCWAVTDSVTAAPYHNGGDLDYDYACLVTSPTGGVPQTSIGNATGGWAGIVAGAPLGWMTMSFGYPAESPFPGYHIIHVASVTWYGAHFTLGGQASYFMGNDMTGGSSGGPWMLNWNHRTAEYADTDASVLTDHISSAAAPLVTGVNSAKRCATNCNRPPTTTTGVFWQELSSSQFVDDANDPNDVTDVVAACRAAGGS